MFSPVFSNNQELVRYLVESGVLKTEAIKKAFLRIDRKYFVPEKLQEEAYGDYPLPIGFGQTISQPWTVAFMLELLQPKEGQKILDIGFGSGWTTALLAEIVGESGQVFGIEIVPEVFAFGKNNLAKFNFLQKGRVKLFLQDGSKGLPENAPFDRILVSAAAEKIPEALKNQLNNEGILVIPEAKGNIWQIQKFGQKFRAKSYPGFAFVPLIEE